MDSKKTIQSRDNNPNKKLETWVIQYLGDQKYMLLSSNINWFINIYFHMQTSQSLLALALYYLLLISYLYSSKYLKQPLPTP
jgi:hypothetical protein